jgi:hypothetical protein
MNCSGSIVLADGSSTNNTLDALVFLIIRVFLIIFVNYLKLLLTFQKILMLHWFLTSYLMRCAFLNRVVHFPAETPINDLESSIDADYLLTLSNPSQGTYPLEENFDDESVWDFPPHLIDGQLYRI